MNAPVTPSPSAPIHAAQRAARLARNAAANLLRIGTSWLILLIVPPLLVHRLDKPTYAVWMLILQISAYANMFDTGLQVSVSRFVAQAEQAQDRPYLARLLSSSAALLCAGALLMLCLVVACSLTMGWLFPSIPRQLVPPAAATLLLVGGALAIAFPANVLAGLSLGLERNQVNAVAGGVSRICAAAGTVWAAMHHQGLVLMGAWTAAGSLVQPLIYIAEGRRHGLRSLLRPAFVKAAAAWQFLQFSSVMLLLELGMLFISGLDLPIVAAYDFRDAGYYAVATMAGNALLVPFGAMLSTLLPLLSGMSMTDDPVRMGRVLLRLTRLSTVLLALLAAPLMLGMPLLLRLWVGADYARHTAFFAELLVAGQALRLLLSPYTMMAFAAGEQTKVLISSLGEGVINLTLSILLARRIGAAGVAVGTLAGALTGMALHFWNSMERTRSMQIDRTELLTRGMVLPALRAALPAAACAYALPALRGTALPLAVLALCALVMCAISWRFTLLPEDRVVLRSLAARVLPAGREA